MNPAVISSLIESRHALAVQKRLVEHYIPKVTEIVFEDKKVPPPTQLEWYPEKLAWHMTIPKSVIRKNPNFTPLQKFLVSETAVGNISRQEVVSMIPPLFMGVEPGMSVLDMCAAPGSKTAQLCEMLHTGEEARVRKLMRQLARQDGREPSPDGDEIAADADEAEAKGDHTDDGRATGLLIANDNNYQRAQMLIHQIKRLNSPNLIVTCHDATMFPSIKVTPEAGRKVQYLKFDRILADVPCSGDGTCRKNVNVWKDWNPANGLGLHVTQVRILTRALQMLKVGGRVVYSTCSLNPIENEAALSAAIDRCGGLSHVNLVDCSQELPGLKRRPGLRSWTVQEKSGRKWNTWDEVEAARKEEGEETAEKLLPSMFPPPTLEGKEEIPFERAMRVYPHLQDTGGFFIAVLEKKSEIRAKPEAAPAPKRNQTAPSNEVNESTETGKPTTKPGSVVAVVNEIEAQTEAGKLPETKEDRPALEAFAPTEVDTEQPLNGSAAEPAALQEEYNAPPPLAAKRELEEDDGHLSPSKRLKGENGSSIPANPTAPTISKPTQSQGPKRGQTQDEVFKYLDSDHPVLQEINSFYGISPRFPGDRYMVRNPSGDPVKAIYYTSSLAKEILTENEGRAMKFVHCGVKMFMKQDAQGQDVCRWRIQAEGLPILDPWVSESRVVRLYKRDTLFKLLQEMFPKLGGGAWKNLNEVGERMRDMSMGCCILRVESSKDEDGFR
jgi:multisite-specific tRNA:(cytosine-C5)-methyltransferase